MGEPAGHDDRVDAVDRRLAVPADLGPPPELLDRVDHVELAVRARETARRRSRAHAPHLHPTSSEIVMLYASITGLASSRSHISSTCARARVGVGASTTSGWSCRCAPRHVRVAERGQRPLDRRARRIDDAGQVRDLDVLRTPPCVIAS